MEEKQRMIDWSKPVRTRDGREVRVLCTDRTTTTGYQVVALVKDSDDYEAVQSYTIEGKYHKSGPESINDLENVPEVTNLWVNVYPYGVGGHISKKDADFWGEDDRVALLRLLIADGVLIDMTIEG